MARTKYRTISVRIPESLMSEVEGVVPLLTEGSAQGLRIIGTASKNTVIRLAIEFGIGRLRRELEEPNRL
jgi:hypothetical protein